MDATALLIKTLLESIVIDAEMLMYMESHAARTGMQLPEMEDYKTLINDNYEILAKILEGGYDY